MITFNKENVAYLKFAFFILLNLLLCSPGLIIFFEQWFRAGSYYTHGPLVVIAFIWLLLRRLKKFPPALENHSFDSFGFIFIIFSLIIYFFALWKNINTLATWGIYIYVFGNSLLFFGRNFIKKNIGIFVYLLLAVPVPQLVIDRFTFELNLFASYTSELFISLLYPSTVRNGNILHVNGHYIAITHECSGLSNLISMFSVVWLMALFQSKKIIAAIDYLISIPAAIISNILRIIIITIFVVNGYEQFALYDWHYEIGMVVFIFIIVLISIFNAFPVSQKRVGFKNLSTCLSSFVKKNGRIFNIYIIFLIMLIFFSFIFTSFVPADKSNIHPSGNELLLRDKISQSIGTWQSKDEIINEYYYDILGTRDLLMRAYWPKGMSTDKDKVYLYIIRSKDNVSAFHRPEVCLRGEGYELLKHNKIDLLLNNGKTITLHRQLFVVNDKALLVYYGYYLKGIFIKDTIKYKLLFHFNCNENASGNLIRISKPVKVSEVIQGEEKMKQFTNEVIPEILKYL